MTDHLNHRKYQLIQQIIRIQNEQLIDVLEQEIKASQQQQAKLWDAIIKPTKPKSSLKDMIAAQGYKPLTSKSFFEQADKVAIKESIEDLLKMLD